LEFGAEKLYLVTAECSFSKFADIGLFDHCPTSQDCAAFLLNFCKIGRRTPARIVVDNGPQFRGREFIEAAEAVLKSDLRFLGTYAHWSAGQIERFNRTILERVRCFIWEFVAEQRAALDDNARIPVSVERVKHWVNKVLLRYNACPRSSGHSPHRTISNYTPWIYAEIREFEPRPVLATVESTPVPRLFKPLIGELWTIRVKPGEEKLWPDVDVPAKLKPAYAVVTILEEIRPGVFKVSLGGKTTTKERSQLHRPLPVPLQNSPGDCEESPESPPSSSSEQRPKRVRRLNPAYYGDEFV